MASGSFKAFQISPAAGPPTRDWPRPPSQDSRTSHEAVRYIFRGAAIRPLDGCRGPGMRPSAFPGGPKQALKTAHEG
eukprot:6126270-Pyramimonas_sp.AAC.1